MAEEKVQEVDLYNASHGKVPRTGGPYADDLRMLEAEKRRAEVEDREPDLDNPPADAGTRLVPKDYLYETDVDKRHFSDKVEVENKPVETVKVDVTSEFDKDPDPAQADWDNDSTKVAALEGARKYQEFKEENKSKAEKVDKSSTPTPVTTKTAKKSDS